LQFEYGYENDYATSANNTTKKDTPKEEGIHDETTPILQSKNIADAKKKEIWKFRENLNTDQINSMIHHLYSLYPMKHHLLSKQLLDFLFWKLIWWILSCTTITIYWYLYFHHTGSENVSDDMVMMAIVDQNNSLYIWIKVLEYWISLQNLLWILYILKVTYLYRFFIFSNIIFLICLAGFLGDLSNFKTYSLHAITNSTNMFPHLVSSG
jgi:hypothetical protein